MDSTSEYVRCSLLKVLTVMVEIGKDGLKVVLNALDVVKVRRADNSSRSCTSCRGFSSTFLVKCGCLSKEKNLRVVRDLDEWLNSVVMHW